MSPNAMFVIGCFCGAAGFFAVFLLLFVQERQVRRNSQKMRRDMEGR